MKAVHCGQIVCKYYLFLLALIIWGLLANSHSSCKMWMGIHMYSHIYHGDFIDIAVFKFTYLVTFSSRKEKNLFHHGSLGLKVDFLKM